MREINAKEFVKKYIHGSRLTYDNHRGIWPFCDMRPRLNDPRPRLFEISKGWEVIGYCKAPYKSMRNYNDALVLEFWGNGEDDETEDDHGLWWIHCRIEDMNFLFKEPNK